MRFYVPQIALLMLLASSSAQGVGYELVTTSNTHLTVRVIASDGFTTELAIDEAPRLLDFGSARSEAFVQGILTPTLFVENLDVNYGPMAFASSIGVTGIPVSIVLDQVSLSYKPHPFRGTLNDNGSAMNASQNIVADTLSGSFSGHLDVDGMMFPFGFSSENFCADNFLPCWPGTGADDPSRPKVRVQDSFDRFVLTGIGMQSTVVGRETIIAVTGGITFQLEVLSSAAGSTLQVIPESSTALLMGLGLVGLGAKQRSLG